MHLPWILYIRRVPSKLPVRYAAHCKIVWFQSNLSREKVDKQLFSNSLLLFDFMIWLLTRDDIHWIGKAYGYNVNFVVVVVVSFKYAKKIYECFHYAWSIPIQIFINIDNQANGNFTLNIIHSLKIKQNVALAWMAIIFLYSKITRFDP